MDYSPWSCKELDTTERLTLNLKALKRIPGKYKSSEAVACLGLVKNNTEANRQHEYSEWEGQRIKWVSDNVRLVDHPVMVFPGMVFPVMVFPVMVFLVMILPMMVFLVMVFPGMILPMIVYPVMVWSHPQ